MEESQTDEKVRQYGWKIRLRGSQTVRLEESQTEKIVSDSRESQTEKKFMLLDEESQIEKKSD